MTNTTITGIGYCGHCGCYHSGPCPRVKAIEYWQDGTVKRVEYHDARPQTSGPINPWHTVTIKPPEAT